jgi:hypothetical protein
MTRFTGDSFKITPISIEGKNIDEKADPAKIYKTISEILGKRTYNPKNIPNKGWVPFQNFKRRDGISFKHGFKPLKLPNGLEILPATSVSDVEITRLKSILSPSSYSKLSSTEKYQPAATDFIFFKKNPLYLLMSTTTSKNVDIVKKEFLLNHPFSDYSLTFNTNPSEFFIPQDLILWLLHKYIEVKGKITNKLSITDISKLYGSSSAPVFVKYEGKSCAEYLQELTYSVVVQRAFYTIEFTLRSDKDLFQFQMNNEGNVEFKSAECEFYEDEKDYTLNSLAKATEIYNTIIPTLKELYKSDKTWVSTDRDKFRDNCREKITKPKK